MTLWRRVIPTIFWLSLGIGTLGTVAVATLTGLMTVERFSDHAHALMVGIRESDFSTRCRTAPNGWKTVLVNGTELETFDLARLPASPAAGPDPELLDRIRAGEPVARRHIFFQNVGGVGLLRLAPSGPCSLVQLRWAVPRGTRLQVVAMAAALSGAGALITGLLSALFVVRPLIRRVQRLSTAATRIGEGPGYISAADPFPDELGTLSRFLDGSNNRLFSATERLSDRHRRLELHLADIAHDLKTPLTAVQLTLEEATQADTRIQALELITRCLEDCVYLSAMVDNLRVGSQLRDGLLPGAGSARAELRETVGQVVRRLTLLGRHKEIELNMARPEREVWCACRPLVLERVIDNLVYNALSHGQPGEHVAVLLEVDRDRFRLTVLDDGPGVPPEELLSLGERMFRGADAQLRAPRGSGLGLAIVAEVCHRCGWDLCFELNDPRGLRVTVTGPVLDVTKPAASAS